MSTRNLGLRFKYGMRASGTFLHLLFGVYDLKKSEYKLLQALLPLKILAVHLSLKWSMHITNVP